MSARSDARTPPTGTAATERAGATHNDEATGGVVYRSIEKKIRETFEPTHLEVADESYMHAVPQGAESHFRLLVVSERFAGKSVVQRHQAVYAALAAEMKDRIHALGLQTMTPSEWAADRARNRSPECLGGSKVNE